MTTRQRSGWCLSVVVALALSACGPDAEGSADADSVDTALGDEVITIGSFDFAASQVIASIYGKVLEINGYEVEMQLGVGPRELLLPALANGLVELVPEYAGTALQFVSAGRATPRADPAETHDALVDALAIDGRIVALDPSAAQDANAIVVTQRTADHHELVTISDLVPLAAELTFGGPPECRSRHFCLRGLETVYDIHFGEFLALDAGGPLTHEALREGHADVALLFTTDAAIRPGGFVQLIDDLGLQPAENVTPLVHAEVIERWGADVARVIHEVSRRLSTDELRGLNLRLNRGVSVDEVAEYWLHNERLS